jgi:hypothetical protein
VLKVNDNVFHYASVEKAPMIALFPRRHCIVRQGRQSSALTQGRAALKEIAPQNGLEDSSVPRIYS